MKILLINPFFREKNGSARIVNSEYLEPPLGVLYLSSYLKKHLADVDVEVFDANLYFEEHINQPMARAYDAIRSRVAEARPDLVGISALYYANAPMVHKTARLVKAVDDRITVVVGGSYPTHLPEKVMADPNIDYAVVSEGEAVLLNLVRCLDGKQPPVDITGLLYRDGQGRVAGTNQERRFIDDLDALPYPDRDAVPMEKYYQGRNVLYRFFKEDEICIGSLNATRGCPNQCTFCGSNQFWGRRIRFRDPVCVVDEMSAMHDRYGTDLFVFNDDNFSASRRIFIRLMDEIERRLPGVRWCSGAGISARSINDDEVIQRMYASGIAYFNLAIESGSDQTLKRIKKPLTVDESRNAVDLIRKYGQGYITGFFITGFPFETRSEVIATIDFARRLDLDWTCLYNLHPFPGSEIYQECLENNIIDGFDLDYGELFQPSNLRYPDYTPRELADINYDANVDINFINNRNLDANPLQALRDFTYVLQLCPDHYMAFYLKGMALERLGRKGEARTCYEHIQKNMATDDLFAPYFKRYGIDVKEEINRLGTTD